MGAAPALASTLSGTTLSGGVPVSVFVSVTGANGQAATTSSASGAFSVTVPDGSYQVAANAPGYMAATETVQVSGSTSTNVALTRTSSTFTPLPVFGMESGWVVADGEPGVFYAWDFVIPQLFRTDDYGGDWLPVTSGNDDPVNGLPKDSALRYGNTRALVTTSGYPGEVAVVLAPENATGAGQEDVFYSTDFGVTWQAIPNAPVATQSNGEVIVPSIYWGHVGATDVLIAQLGTANYVANMSAASPMFTQMTTPYTPSSSDTLAVADGADQPWVAVANGSSGTVNIYPLTTALTPPTAAATATGFPVATSPDVGFGGTSSAGFPPSALIESNTGPDVLMATKAPGSDSFGTPAMAAESSNVCLPNLPSLGVELPVAPNSGGNAGAGFSGNCYVQDSGGTLTLFPNYGNVDAFGEGDFAFDSGYNGTSDSVILARDNQSGVAKSASAGSDGSPSFPLGQDAAAGTDPGSGGIAISGIDTPIIDDATFGPAGASQVATAIDPGGGGVSLASDNGGGSTNTVVDQGSESVAWWQGASGSWLVYGFGALPLPDSPPRTGPAIAAFENWSSSTPGIAAPNLQGSDETALGSNGTQSFDVDSLAPVPGADKFFAGESLNHGFDTGPGQVRLLTIAPGSPPSVTANTQIAASQVTTSVADLAYCPALGSAPSIADTLFIAEGTPSEGGGTPNGALLRVSGATSGSPTVTTVASVPSPRAVNVITADCASGTVYAGLGFDETPQQPGQVYQSTDGGQTFSLLPGPVCTGSCAVTAIATEPSNPDDIVVALGQSGLVFSSTDGGQTWTAENDPPSSGYDFQTAGITQLAIAPAPYTLTPSNDGFFRPHSVTAGEALVGTGGGEFAASVLTATKPPPPTGSAPRITSFSISPKRFGVSKKPTAVSTRKKKVKAQLGATFHYGLSIAARVTISIERALPGAKVRGKCVAITRKLARHHYTRCTRYKLAGTLGRTGSTGTNKIPFSGRIGRKSLPAGSYQAIIEASANGHNSNPRSTSFTIVG
jgi:hypothetical protein